MVFNLLILQLLRFIWRSTRPLSSGHGPPGRLWWNEKSAVSHFNLFIPNRTETSDCEAEESGGSTGTKGGGGDGGWSSCFCLPSIFSLRGVIYLHLRPSPRVGVGLAELPKEIAWWSLWPWSICGHVDTHTHTVRQREVASVTLIKYSSADSLSLIMRAAALITLWTCVWFLHSRRLLTCDAAKDWLTEQR